MAAEAGSTARSPSSPGQGQGGCCRSGQHPRGQGGSTLCKPSACVCCVCSPRPSHPREFLVWDSLSQSTSIQQGIRGPLVVHRSEGESRDAVRRADRGNAGCAGKPLTCQPVQELARRDHLAESWAGGCRTGAGGLQYRAQQPEKPRQEVGRRQIVKGLTPRVKRIPYPWTGGLKQDACQICVLERTFQEQRGVWTGEDLQ